MGIIEDTMGQMGYGGEMMNALKVLSSDQSKKILQAVAMSKPPEASIQSPPIPSYNPPAEQPNPEEVMSVANQMVNPNISQASANIQQPVQVANVMPVQSQPVPSGGAMPLIQKYFPKEQWTNAYKVMMGESGGNPKAIGDNYPIKGEVRPSYGLFQIRTFPGRPAPEQLLDPEVNVATAAALWKAQGWRPWTAAKKLGIK